MSNTFSNIIATSFLLKKNMAKVEQKMKEGRSMEAAIRSVYPDWSDEQVKKMMTKMKSGMASY